MCIRDSYYEFRVILKIFINYNKNKMETTFKPKRVQNFFKVSEDSKMLKFWEEERKQKKLSDICSLLANSLVRSIESVRDRLRKYLILLSSEDKENLYKYGNVI